MSARLDREEPIVVLAPTLTRARRGARIVAKRRPRSRIRAMSWPEFLERGERVDRVVLCPAGREVEHDVEFLADVGRRLRWTAPARELYSAIAGLLAHLPPERRGSRAAHDGRPALLLEGRVTGARAKRAAASDARHWILEHAANARLSSRALDALEREGVRWSVLHPIEVVAVLAEPRLARARERWKRLLPRDTPVWVWRRT